MAMGARKRTWDEQEGQQQQREGAAGRGHGAPGASRPNQILPVADLPADFDGTPVDGAQYLAVVRQQAHTAPSVVRVRDPYAALQEATAAARRQREQRRLPGELPSAAWRSSFLVRFRNMRESFSNRPPPDGGEAVGIPGTRSAKRWLAFLHGEDGELDGKRMMTRSERREPSSLLLARFQTHQILYLVELLRDTILERSQASDNSSGGAAEEAIFGMDGLYARWLFALLAHLDERLVGDDISTLRTLARACISAIAAQRVRLRATDIHAELGAWMVVCAVTGVWSQHDLWDDAGVTLAGLAESEQEGVVGPGVAQGGNGHHAAT